MGVSPRMLQVSDGTGYKFTPFNDEEGKDDSHSISPEREIMSIMQTET